VLTSGCTRTEASVDGSSLPDSGSVLTPRAPHARGFLVRAARSARLNRGVSRTTAAAVVPVRAAMETAGLLKSLSFVKPEASFLWATMDIPVLS